MIQPDTDLNDTCYFVFGKYRVRVTRGGAFGNRIDFRGTLIGENPYESGFTPYHVYCVYRDENPLDWWTHQKIQSELASLKTSLEA